MVNELEVQQGGNATVLEDQRGDKRDVRGAEKRHERGSANTDAQGMAESQVLQAWRLTEMPGPKHPGIKLFEEHVQKVMHSILKSRRQRQARRAKRAMKRATKRGDPEGSPCSLSEKIDHYVEDWKVDQIPQQTAVGLAAQRAYDIMSDVTSKYRSENTQSEYNSSQDDDTD